MEIYASHRKLRTVLDDDAACERQFGTPMAKKLRLRLIALRAAESLGDFWPPKSGPERCHELKGDCVGVFSMNVKQPYRLLFKAIESDELLDRSDECGRWKSITEIEILAIEDTHG